MEKASKYDLVLFDLDGTLLNTIPDLGNAVNHALGIRSLPVHEMYEYPAMVGHGIRNLVTKALPEELRADEGYVSEVLADFSSYYCPEKAITLSGGDIASIDYSKCVGCGLCVSKCPRKVIHMVE